MATAIAVESSTSTTCWPTRPASSPRRSARKLSTTAVGRDGAGRGHGSAAARKSRTKPGCGRSRISAAVALLHDASRVHHRDAVAEAQRLGHVVGDEHDGLAQPPLQLP